MERRNPPATPGTPSAHEYIQSGDDAYDNEQYERAIGYFNKAAQKKLPDAHLFLKRARTWFYLEHFYLAIKELQQVIQREPHLAEAYRLLSQCQARLGNLPAAIGTLGTAIALLSVPSNSEFAGEKAQWEKDMTLLVARHAGPSTPLLGATEAGKRKRTGINILSLDGGGVRGLSTCELLIELQKQLGPENPIYEVFDLIGGASTGGFISLALLAGLNADDCKELYINMSKKVFDPAHKGVVPRYNANILVNEIKKVAEERLNDPEAKLLPSMKGPRVFCIATQAKAEPVKPFIFRNYAFEKGATSPFEGCDSAPIWEAARATSAAPYYFASYDKEGVGNLIDGGILTNNPVQVACEEAVRHFHAQRINCIVSLGTGIQTPPEKQHNKSLLRKLIDLARNAGLAPIIDRFGDLLNLAPMLIDIVTGSEMTHDLTEPIAAALGVRYYRLNAPVPATNLADCSDEALNGLVSHTQEYITKNRDMFSEVAKVLMEEHSS